MRLCKLNTASRHCAINIGISDHAPGAQGGHHRQDPQRDCHNLECRSQDQTPPVGPPSGGPFNWAPCPVYLPAIQTRQSVPNVQLHAMRPLVESCQQDPRSGTAPPHVPHDPCRQAAMGVNRLSATRSRQAPTPTSRRMARWCLILSKLADALPTRLPHVWPSVCRPQDTSSSPAPCLTAQWQGTEQVLPNPPHTATALPARLKRGPGLRRALAGHLVYGLFTARYTGSCCCTGQATWRGCSPRSQIDPSSDNPPSR